MSHVTLPIEDCIGKNSAKTFFFLNQMKWLQQNVVFKINLNERAFLLLTHCHKPNCYLVFYRVLHAPEASPAKLSYPGKSLEEVVREGLGLNKIMVFYISPYSMFSIMFASVMHFHNHLWISLSLTIVKEFFATICEI